MKKLFAILLTVVMIFSLATVAFAEETEAAALKSKAFTSETIFKAYTVVGPVGDAAVYPAETLSFEVEAGENNPDDTALTVDEIEVDGTDLELTINVPVYTKVGVYEYVISEVAGETQGVTYTTDTIAVTVLVTYNYEESKLDAEVILSTPDGKGGKIDTFTNTYELGSLTVSKVVTGNLGDLNKKFDVTVEFSSVNPVLSTITYTGGTIAADQWKDGKVSVDISLAHNEFVTFDNIPAGVTYTVVEKDYTGGDLNGENAYDKAEYDFSDSTKTIAKEDADTVEITNNKSTEVATGIVLDSMPYVLILAVAVFGMFAMLAKKRYEV